MVPENTLLYLKNALISNRVEVEILCGNDRHENILLIGLVRVPHSYSGRYEHEHEPGKLSIEALSKNL